MPTVLIIEDLPGNQELYSSIVQNVGAELRLNITLKVVAEFEQAQRFFTRVKQGLEEVPVLILLDMEIWHNNRRDYYGGYELMKQYHDDFHDTLWITITANELLQRRAASGEYALFDQLYELKPFDFYLKGRSRELQDMVRRALQLVKEAAEERSSTTNPLPGIDESDDLHFVAPSYQLYYQIRTVAKTSRTIFLYGEAGTGKATLAAFIHHHSPRKDKKFWTIDGKLESSILKKLLFEGNDGKSPLLEQLKGGTLYIAHFDQLGGGSKEETFELQRELRHYIVYLDYDVRLIAGINERREDITSVREIVLPELLDKAISLDLPSLNERKNDIPILVELFVRQFNEREKKELPSELIDAPKIYDLLKSYDWSNGNISLLKMVAEEALLTNTPAVTVDDFTAILDRMPMMGEGRRRSDTEKQKEQKSIAPLEVEPKTPGKSGKEPLVITAEDLRRFGIR